MEAADPPREELDRVVVRGVAWTGALRWGSQLVRWGCTTIIARILTPAEFGVVATALLFIGLVDRMSELGLGVAIVRHRITDPAWIGELNTVSIGLGLLTALIAFAAASLVAAFFHQPEVAPVLGWLSVSLAITAIAVVPRAVLSLRMQFRLLAAWDAAGAVASAFAVLGLALRGAGYWALVVGQLVAVTIPALALAFTARTTFHRPRFGQRLKHEIRYGLDIVGNRLAWYFYNQADFAVVGRMLGKTALGAYEFAWQIASLPVDRVSALVSQVATPIFARVQDRKVELARYLLRLTEGLGFITMPMAAGIGLTAPELVPIVLGPQWHAAILPVQILAGYAAVRAITMLLTNVLQATGHARSVLQFAILAAVVLPVSFVIGARTAGVAGVATAWVIGYPLVLILPARLALAQSGVPVARYLASLALGLSATVTMLAAVLGAAWLARGTSLVALLTIKIVVGVLAYGGSLLLVGRDRVGTIFRTLRGSGSTS